MNVLIFMVIAPDSTSNSQPSIAESASLLNLLSYRTQADIRSEIPQKVNPRSANFVSPEADPFSCDEHSNGN